VFFYGSLEVEHDDHIGSYPNCFLHVRLLTLNDGSTTDDTTFVRSHGMKVLVVDIGGTYLKMRATGQRTSHKFPSGPTMTPDQMVLAVHKIARRWKYDVLSIGYPGPVLHGMPVADPHNLGPEWVGFDYQKAFDRPVRLINDAAMQAMGSYKGGKMLFLGLGTGLGSAFIVDGVLASTELGHLPYRKGTFEDYVGKLGLEKHGIKKWRRDVADVVARLIAALQPDDVVLGGGSVKKLKSLPPGCRLGDNANAILGGFRLWETGKTATLPLVQERAARKWKTSEI
jgi:polyphosphate glucokinase